MKKLIKKESMKGDIYYHNLSAGRADCYMVAGRWEGNVVLAPQNQANNVVMIYTDNEMIELQESGKLTYRA